MRFRTKIVFSSFFFLAVSAGVGAWCYLNIQREEGAFRESRRAALTRAAVADIDYFFTRRVRALQNHVLLNDEAEKLQFQQAGTQAESRLSQWKKSAADGRASAAEEPAVRAAFAALADPSGKIMDLMERGRKAEAMALVEKEFLPASAAALKAIAEVKSRAEASAQRADQDMMAELRRNHLALLGGLGLIAFFGLVFLVSFYRSLMRPIHLMKSWADRVAQGERNIPWRFPGQNELTELATSLGEMAIQLTRPKAVPPRSAAAHAAEPAPAPAVPAATTPTASPAPAPARPAPAAKAAAAAKGKSEEFEEAVEGFRELLAQMAGQTGRSQKIG